MARQTRDSVGIEGLVRRQFHSSLRGCQLVSKPDAIGNLRTELKPAEIQVHTKSHFTEIIHEVEQNRFLPVATDIKTGSSSGDDIRTIVAFPLCTPFQIQGKINGHSQHIDMCAFIRYRSAGFGFIGDGSAGEHHSGAETKVEELTKPQIADETDMKTGQERTDARMENLLLIRMQGIGREFEFTIRHMEGREVHTQLETEMEEFIIHIGSVHRTLRRDRSKEQRTKRKD